MFVCEREFGTGHSVGNYVHFSMSMPPRDCLLGFQFSNFSPPANPLLPSSTEITFPCQPLTQQRLTPKNTNNSSSTTHILPHFPQHPACIQFRQYAYQERGEEIEEEASKSKKMARDTKTKEWIMTRMTQPTTSFRNLILMSL